MIIIVYIHYCHRRFVLHLKDFLSNLIREQVNTNSEAILHVLV